MDRGHGLVAILGLLFVLVFPRAADVTAVAGRRFWPTVGGAALVGIAGPIFGVLGLATIVGIPLGLGILSALNVLAPLGYVASSLILGRLMVKDTGTGARIGAFFAGFGILRAAALIPGIGFLVWFVVCLYGLGALTQAAWRTGRARETEMPSAPRRAEGAPPTGDAINVAGAPRRRNPLRTTHLESAWHGSGTADRARRLRGSRRSVISERCGAGDENRTRVLSLGSSPQGCR